MTRTAIYTVITGEYDTVKAPMFTLAEADYFLFTNSSSIISRANPNERIGVWHVIPLQETDVDNILLSRKVKMLPHKYLDVKYDISIYIDGDMVITDDLVELAAKTLADNTLMAAYHHSKFTDVRSEIESLKLKGRVPAEVVDAQWNRYLAWGFEDNIGHTENGMLIRRHNHPAVKELMELWWAEFQNGCCRDQVSFMPCVHRLNFTPHLTILDGSIWHSPYLTIQKHCVPQI